MQMDHVFSSSQLSSEEEAPISSSVVADLSPCLFRHFLGPKAVDPMAGYPRNQGYLNGLYM